MPLKSHGRFASQLGQKFGFRKHRLNSTSVRYTCPDVAHPDALHFDVSSRDPNIANQRVHAYLQKLGLRNTAELRAIRDCQIGPPCARIIYVVRRALQIDDPSYDPHVVGEWVQWAIKFLQNLTTVANLTDKEQVALANRAGFLHDMSAKPQFTALVTAINSIVSPTLYSAVPQYKLRRSS